jgi:murein hydrolase activator
LDGMLPFNKTVFKILALLAAAGVLFGIAGSPGAAPAGAAAGAAIDIDRGVVIVSALNMRRCPDVSCPIVKTLINGDHLDITGKEDDWLQVRHGEASGYVFGGYVGHDRADASELEQSLQKAAEIEKRVSLTGEEISRMERRAVETRRALEDIERELASAVTRLEQLKKESALIEARIRETGAQISNTSAAIAEKKDYAGKRLVALYKLNRLGGMNLLASAGSTSDLFRRKAAIEAIIVQDEENIRELVDAEKRLVLLQEQAVEEKKQQDQLEDHFRQTQAALDGKKEQRKALLAQIASDKEKALAEMKALEASGRRIAETIAALKQQEEENRYGDKNIFSEYQGLLKMPVEGKIISKFGRYTEPHSGAASFKNGIELAADRGDPVRAVFDGETSFSDWLSGFGRVIIISHGNSFYSVYGHLGELFAGMGDKVKADDVIATVGDSGSNSRPFLYFEIRHKGNPLDPLDWIEKRSLN